jgi:glycosyltransferase involved in cell wall biosynthesis
VTAPRIFAVVPARDEHAHIAHVIATMPACVCAIVVIDDGSIDKTSQAAVCAGDSRVTVLSRSPARGVGDAIVTGFRHALDRGADIVCVLAGDGQMHPDDLPAILAPILEHKADFVQGNRLAWPNYFWFMPLDRHLAVLILGRLTRWASGYPIVDSQCGYIAVTRATLLALPLDDLWRSYGYPNDLILRLSEIHARLAHVPVRPMYQGQASRLSVRHVPKIVELIARGVIRLSVKRAQLLVGAR